MTEPTVQLQTQDAHALARAVSGLSIEGLPASPGIQLILKMCTAKQPPDYAMLQRILRDGGILEQVLKLDPNAPASLGTVRIHSLSVQRFAANYCQRLPRYDTHHPFLVTNVAQLSPIM